ncbi:MAG: hypothetical protein JJT89_02715 [Nitriliruptoraceae bacterium]|nr:hypothetical protein [Nitriliruptoraceae bacterium]
MPGDGWGAWRLVLAYGQPETDDGPFVELVEKLPVTKPTWSDDLDLDEFEGTLLDVRDDQDRLRFRTVVPGMFPLTRHGPITEDADIPESFVLDEPEAGIFTVVVPDLDAAHEIVLLGTPSVINPSVIGWSGIDPSGGMQELARLLWGGAAYV